MRTLSAVAAAGLVIAFISLAASSVAAQQQFSWDNYCTVGTGSPLCSSIELKLTTPDSGGTDVAIRMRNLEGTLGTTPWAMYDVSFNFALPSDSAYSDHEPYPTPVMTGTAQEIVTADSATCAIFPFDCSGPSWKVMAWEYRADGSIEPGIAGLRSTVSDEHQPDGIVGCDLVPQGTGSYSAHGFYQTCGDGWVNVNMWFPETLTLTDQSAPFMVTYDGSVQSSCQFGKTCMQVTATPEPGTLLLVGSGLAGLVGYCRRRQSNSV